MLLARFSLQIFRSYSPCKNCLYGFLLPIYLGNCLGMKNYVFDAFILHKNRKCNIFTSSLFNFTTPSWLSMDSKVPTASLSSPIITLTRSPRDGTTGSNSSQIKFTTLSSTGRKIEHMPPCSYIYVSSKQI